MTINATELLKTNRPEITESSVAAYVSNLEKLHDRLHGSRHFDNLEWLKQSDDIISSLTAHCSSYLTARNYLN